MMKKRGIDMCVFGGCGCEDETEKEFIDYINSFGKGDSKRDLKPRGSKQDDEKKRDGVEEGDALKYQIVGNVLVYDFEAYKKEREEKEKILDSMIPPYYSKDLEELNSLKGSRNPIKRVIGYIIHPVIAYRAEVEKFRDFANRETNKYW